MCGSFSMARISFMFWYCNGVICSNQRMFHKYLLHHFLRYIGVMISNNAPYKWDKRNRALHQFFVILNYLRFPLWWLTLFRLPTSFFAGATMLPKGFKRNTDIVKRTQCLLFIKLE
jgi:hypothetical protein